MKQLAKGVMAAWIVEVLTKHERDVKLKFSHLTIFCQPDQTWWNLQVLLWGNLVKKCDIYCIMEICVHVITKMVNDLKLLKIFNMNVTNVAKKNKP